VGEYFKAVNVSKKEYVDHGYLGVSKLWEWCVNKEAGLFPYLLRKSNESGGGDISNPDAKYAGRWAGDEVYLVGDYDKSDLYEKAGNEFTNISQPLVEEYNDFMEVEELKLKPLGS